MIHLSLQHNHELRQPAPISLIAEEEQLVIHHRNVNTKTSQIKHFPHQTYRKSFMAQKLKNMMEKVVEGGKIEYATDAAGEITTFYCASKIMIESFSSSDPPLI